jgi:putative acetyltransferase
VRRLGALDDLPVLIAMSQPPVIDIHVLSPADIDEARALLLDYQSDLGLDLCFQGFEQEMAELPGGYSPPNGVFLLARVDGLAAGCCALRPLPLSDHLNACEMKRLFVRHGYRGLGLGRRLVDATLAQAHVAGYNTVLLDTLNDMETARGLYQTVGFVETEPYYLNPLPGAHYLKRAL